MVNCADSHGNESAGVREYWIVVPKSAEIYAYTLIGDHFEETAVYEKGSRPTSTLFPELSLELDWIFGEVVPVMYTHPLEIHYFYCI